MAPNFRIQNRLCEKIILILDFRRKERRICCKFRIKEREWKKKESNGESDLNFLLTGGFIWIGGERESVYNFSD